MKNILGYTANVARSVVYASRENIKEMFPNVVDFKETNEELFRSVYTDTINYKQTFKRMMPISLNNPIYEASKVLKKSIKDDLASGNFYNMDRLNKQIVGLDDSYDGLDNMDFEGDDFNFDSDDDLDFNMDDDFGGDFGAEDKSSNVSKKISNKINIATSRMNAESIGNAVFRSAEYTAEVSKENTNLLYVQNKQLFNSMNKNMDTINSNIGALLPVVANTTAMADNQKKYFEETTKLFQDQTSLLRDIKSMLEKEFNPKKKEQERRTGYSDIAIGGIVDIKKWIKQIKSNIEDDPTLGLLKSTNSMMGDGTNMLAMLASNPIGMILQTALGGLIPKFFKKSAKRFDKTIGNLFGNITTKINFLGDKDAYDSEIGKKMAGFFKLLSPDDRLKTKLSPGGYNKDVMKWNGKAQKALTDVIPQQLSKIISLLSGQTPKIFDYKSGKFVDHKDLSRDYSRFKDSFKDSATGEVAQLMKEQAKFLNLSFDSFKSLSEDIDKLMKTLYTKGINFNYNNKKLEGDYYGIYDDDNFEIIKGLFQGLSREKKMELGQKIMSERSSQNNMMDMYEQQSHIYTLLENNLFGDNDYIADKFGNVINTAFQKNTPLAIKDAKGHSGFWFLENILSELKYIGDSISYSGNGRGRGKRPRGPQPPRPNRSNYNIPNDSRRVDREWQEYLYEEERYDREQADLVSKYGSITMDGTDTADLKRKSYYRSKKIKDMKDAERDALIPTDSFEAILRDMDKKDKFSLNPINNGRRIFSFGSKIMDTIDKKIYRIFFGKDDNINRTDSSLEPTGMMDSMLWKLRSTMDTFSSWMEERVLEPLANTVDKIKAKASDLFDRIGGKDFVNKVKTFFVGNKATGEDGIFSNIFNNIKQTAKGAWSTTKDAFRTTFGPIVRNVKGRWDNFNGEYARNIGDVINDALNNILPHYAEGTDEIPEDQFAVVGEGEAVLPKEEAEVYRKFKNFLLDKANAINKGKSGKNIASSLHRKMKNVLGNDEKGSESYNTKMRRMLEMMNTDKFKGQFKGDSASKFGGILSQVLDELDNPTETSAQKFSKQVMDELTNGFKKVFDIMIPKDVNKERKTFGSITDEVTKSIFKNAPDVISKSLMGGGISLVTGMVGGPLLGAAAGAGFSILKRSEKLQDMLFGTKGEDGKRQGGFVENLGGKKFVDKLRRVLPNTKRLAIVGGVAGLMPFMPFGPIAGIMMGSAWSFANDQDKIKNKLFGEGTWWDKNKEKLQKNLGRLGAGALVGSFVGPFGLLGNAAIGAGLGFATTSEKFQNAIFGEKDKNGKRMGGLLPELRDKVVTPMVEYVQSFGKKWKGFITKHIITPIKDAMQPIATQGKVIGKTVLKFVTKGLKTIFKNTGVSIFKLFGEILRPTLKAVANTAVGSVLALPVVAAKSIGKLGSTLRKRQIKKGNADYMTAAERVQYRKSHRMGFGDKFATFDQLVAGYADNDIGKLEELRNNFVDIRSSHKENNKEMDRSVAKMGRLIGNEYNYLDSKNLIRLIKKGKGQEVLSTISNDRVMDPLKKKALLNKMTEEIAKYEELKSKGVSQSAAYKEMIDKMRKQGIKVPSSIAKDPEELSKYIGLMNKEIKNTKKYQANRTPEEEMRDIQKEEQEKNEEYRNKIINNLTTISENLNTMAHPTVSTEVAATAVPNTNGNIRDEKGREYHIDNRGNKIYNMGDADTKDSIEEEQEEKATNKSFKDKVLGLLSKSKLGGAVEKVKEKKGLVTEILDKAKWAALALIFAKPIFNFAKNTVVPWVKEKAVPWLKDTALPALLDGLGFVVKTTFVSLGKWIYKLITKGFKKMFNATIAKLPGINPMEVDDSDSNDIPSGINNLDKAGQKYKSGDTNVDLSVTDDDMGTTSSSGSSSSNSSNVGENNNSDDGGFLDNLLYQGSKAFATGGANLKSSVGILEKVGKGLKFASKIGEINPLHPIRTVTNIGKNVSNALFGTNFKTKTGLIGKGISGLGSITKKGAGALDNLGSKLEGNFVNKFLNEHLGSTAADLFNSFTKKSTSETVEAGIRKLGKETAEEVAEAGTKGLVDKAIDLAVSKFKNVVIEILTSPTVTKNIAGDIIQNIIEKCLPEMVQKLTKKLFSKAAEMTAKVISALGSAGLINIAFAAMDFINGFFYAKENLQILEEPSLVQKIICGLVKALTGYTIVLSFIPDDWWLTAWFDVLMPIFGKEDSDMQKKREAARQEIAKYNQEHGTGYDYEEYLKATGQKKSLVSALNPMNLVKKYYSTMGYLAKKGLNAIGLGSVASWAENKIDYINNGLKSWGKSVDDWYSNADTNVANTASNLYNSAKSKASSVFNWVKGKLGFGGPYDGMGGPTITDNKDFLQYIIPAAQSAYSEYGIFPSVMIAQAINESNWGKSYLARTDNNLFGIKKPGKHDPSLNVEQGSWATDDGGYYAKYNSWDDSVKDHGFFLKNNSRYPQAGVFGAKTPEEQITAIKKAGYASDPNYVSTTMSIINSNNLTQYDTGISSTGSNSNSNSISQSNNSTSSQNIQEQKQSGLSSLFSDAGTAMNNSINKLYGLGGWYLGMGGEYQGVPTGTAQVSSAVEQYNSIFEKYGKEYNIDPNWIKAICQQESSGDPNNNNGYALGLMQIEKGGTTDEFIDFGKNKYGQTWTANDRADPDKSVAFGAYRLAHLLQKYNGDALKATQAYNFSEYSLDPLIKAFPDDWMSHRGEVGRYNGTGLSSYGDKEYIEHVLQYYHGDNNFGKGTASINSSGATANGESAEAGQTQQQSSQSGITGFFSDLGTSFSNYISRFYGMDPGASNSSSGSSSNSSGMTVNATGTIKDVINTAMAQIGNPYCWERRGEPLTEELASIAASKGHSLNQKEGANGAWKQWLGKPCFDCSGLMDYSFKQHGINIGSWTGEQQNAGTAVSVGQEQPGDLVFFGSGTPHHVGMALGDGKFIEAPCSGKTVRISELSSRSDLSQVRRISASSTSNNKNADSTDSSTKTGSGGWYDGIGGPVDDYFSSTLKGNLTSGFGYRNVSGTIPKNHTGIDIGAAMGTSIKSPISGKVVRVSDTKHSNGLGNMMVIRDGKGGEHYFGHMNQMSKFKPGETVQAGQSIGNVGNTGNSTGPHLHYEVRDHDTPVDPNQYSRRVKIFKGKGGEEIKPTNIKSNKDPLKVIINLLSQLVSNTDLIRTIIDLLGNGNNASTKNDARKQQTIDKLKKASETSSDFSINQITEILQEYALGE